MPDGVEHCDRKLSTKVLAELFQAVEQFIGLPQCGMIAE